ncbi:MAG: ferredoxin family protein [Verrucomicrobia bacterium]|nr:ferredoxin family protein [Verrucomicrobiota bacterium]
MSLLTVILSRSPSQDPRKRELEEQILAALSREPDVTVATIPHLYDFVEADESLRSVTGSLLVLAWLYPRAIHWTLDRLSIKGQYGNTQIPRPDSEKDEPKNSTNAQARTIWSLDLRDGDTAAMHIAEIQRILRDLRATTPAATSAPASVPKSEIGNQKSKIHRWYPVIDYGRCNQCMECLDFCLFGVYGVDDDGHLIVESPDNCKKGCPACSRVCPQNAIIFPMHRTPAIAGVPGAGVEVQKLDLSELFGAPAAAQLATAERNAALAAAEKEAKPKDNLDKLMDALDDAKL